MLTLEPEAWDLSATTAGGVGSSPSRPMEVFIAEIELSETLRTSISGAANRVLEERVVTLDNEGCVLEGPAAAVDVFADLVFFGLFATLEPAT